jgi:L-2-hydroxyglutarate oxidase
MHVELPSSAAALSGWVRRWRCWSEASGSLVVLEAEAQGCRAPDWPQQRRDSCRRLLSPGSLKAKLCAQKGAPALYAFCEAEGIAHDRCGKLIVATSAAEQRAARCAGRARAANGLTPKSLDRGRTARVSSRTWRASPGCGSPKPASSTISAVAAAYARRVQALGGELRTGWRLAGVRRQPEHLTLISAHGGDDHLRRILITCAGLQADRVARLCGVEPGVRIVPFRGEYYELAPSGACSLVRGLIYPVPNPKFPFLGVHYTRKIDGSIEAGPNAVLALPTRGLSQK